MADGLYHRLFKVKILWGLDKRIHPQKGLKSTLKIEMQDKSTVFQFW